MYHTCSPLNFLYHIQCYDQRKKNSNCKCQYNRLKLISFSQTIQFVVVHPVNSDGSLDMESMPENESHYIENWEDLDYRLDWNNDNQNFLVFEFDEFTIIFNLNSKNLYISYT